MGENRSEQHTRVPCSASASCLPLCLYPYPMNTKKNTSPFPSPNYPYPYTRNKSADQNNPLFPLQLKSKLHTWSVTWCDEIRGKRDGDDDERMDELSWMRVFGSACDLPSILYSSVLRHHRLQDLLGWTNRTSRFLFGSSRYLLVLSYCQPRLPPRLSPFTRPTSSCCQRKNNTPPSRTFRHRRRRCVCGCWLPSTMSSQRLPIARLRPLDLFLLFFIDLIPFPFLRRMAPRLHTTMMTRKANAYNLITYNSVHNSARVRTQKDIKRIC